MALACYLDDSGTSGVSITSMAGFVGPLEQWPALEKEWCGVYEMHQINLLHTKDFHDNRGQFQKWGRSKKRQFADDLFTPASGGRIAGISVGLSVKQFDLHKKNTQTLQSTSAIGMCFGGVVGQILLKHRPYAERSGVHFLVESGNSNTAELEKYFHKMAEFELLKPVLKSITFIKKDSCKAIQVADFLAFYGRRRLQNLHASKGRIILPECPFINIMNRHVPILMRLINPAPQGRLGDIDEYDNMTEIRKALGSMKRN